MATEFYSDVKDLPAAIQSALAAAGFGKTNVQVKVTRELSLNQSALGDGYRGFVQLINLTTSEISGHVGSWGGSNMFESRPVDDDHGTYVLPDNGAVVKGQMGGGRPVMATVYLNPAGLPKELTSGTSDLSEREGDILGCFVQFTSVYRREVFQRKDVTTAEFDALVERGYVKRNKAGAMTITTAGKNGATRGWR